MSTPYMTDSVELYAAEYARAALAQSTPPGYVLVPREPTEAMYLAAERAPRDLTWTGSVYNRWSAMIAAAQAQQDGGEQT